MKLPSKTEICSLDSLSFFLGVLQSSSSSLIIDFLSNSVASTSLCDLFGLLEQFEYDEVSRFSSVIVAIPASLSSLKLYKNLDIFLHLFLGIMKKKEIKASNCSWKMKSTNKLYQTNKKKICGKKNKVLKVVLAFVHQSENVLYIQNMLEWK